MLQQIKSDCLASFQEHLRLAPTSQLSANVVRCLIIAVGEEAPLDVVLQVGQCLVDLRRGELRREAERN